MDILPYLLSTGVITAEQARDAEELQRQLGLWIGEILMDNGWADEQQVYKAKAHETGMPFVDLNEVHPEPDALALVSAEIALRYGLLPLKIDPNTGDLWVALYNVIHQTGVDEVRLACGRSVRLVMTAPRAMGRALMQAYTKDGQA